jgi:hypothetical protein
MSYVEPAEIRDHLKVLVGVDGGPAENRPFLTPFVWRPPEQIPRRQWLYGKHHVRGFMSATFAPGGVGKSMLVLLEAAAMASGRALAGIMPADELRVGYFNGEDPPEETERRLAALMLKNDLTADHFGDRLFLGSGRDEELVIAEQTRDGTIVRKPDVDRVRQAVGDLKLDVLILDPFVSTHRVTENDNNAIDVVAKQWVRLAGETNIACELVHHTVKAALGRETRVEDGRGGGALLFAARSARVLNTMSAEEAEAAGLSPKVRRYYFRVDNGKANLAPPPDGSSWYRFVGVELGNGAGFEAGDNVGVPVSWEWPDHLAREGKPAKLKIAGQKVLQAFRRLVDEGRTTTAPVAPGIRPDTLAVADAELRKMAIRLGLCTEERPAQPGPEMTRWQAAARQAWARGTKEVQEANVLRYEGGFWWELRRRDNQDQRVTSREAED